MYGAIEDITESKQAAEALRQSEERFRLIAETIGEVFWMADPKVQRISYVSPGYERVWGRSAESVYQHPRSFLDAVHPEDRERVTVDLETDNTAQVFNYEFRIVRPDGAIRWIWGRGFPVRDSTGQIRCLVGIAQDITERKRAQEQLAVLGAALAAAANGIVITDAAGRIVWVNLAFTQLTGYASEEVLGRNPRLLKSGVHDRAFYEHLWGTINPGQVWSGQVKNRRKDGTVYTEEMTITPVRQNGGISHFIAIKQDITEREHAQAEIFAWTEQLEQRVTERTTELDVANKELEAFSYSVAHDLRAPLRAIDGFSAMLLDHCAQQLDRRSQHYLHRVRSGAEHMDQLISDLLTLSRVTSSEMHCNTVDLNALARTIAAELQKTQSVRRVEFVIADGVVVEGDSGLLRSALENLLGNAWKYTSKHATGRIEFGCTEQEGKPVYFVRDDGARFDMAYVGKLFGSFQRLHTTDDFEGTGIGLATVQRIIHRHGRRTCLGRERGGTRRNVLFQPRHSQRVIGNIKQVASGVTATAALRGGSAAPLPPACAP